MPNRVIRESILDSEAVNSLTPEAEVFYRRLMSVVDDYGRFDARIAVLRSRLYPLQLEKVREASVERCLAECEAARLVRLYVAGGKQYLSFLKLGAPRSKESRWPSPPDEEVCAHVRADENICAQTRAYVPYSGSGSKSSTKSESNARAGPAGGVPEELKNGFDQNQKGAELAQVWSHHCTRRVRGIVADKATDKEPEFSEMLRQGGEFEAIQAAILDPKRDRNEHLWQFRQRLMPTTGPPKPAAETFAEKIQRQGERLGFRTK